MAETKPEPKAREVCGKPVEVLFYSDVPCNRLKGHDGDCAPAAAAHETVIGDAGAETATLKGDD